MTRYHGSSAKKKQNKSQKSTVKTNSLVDLEQKTDGGLEPEGGENSFSPTQPVATAATPPPPADPSLKDPFPPIAKLEDPHDDTKKETASIS
jgi:hypothetical protein